ATWGLGVYAAKPAWALAATSRLLADGAAEAETRLAAVRVLQRALGGLVSSKVRGTVWEGYTPRRDLAEPAPGVGSDAVAGALAAVRRAFPSGEADLDRELSRSLAVLEDDDPATLAKVAGRLTADSNPIDDLHYLIVLARLKAPRTPALTAKV